MAQHDYVLNDAAGAAFRADINAALAAIASSNSGATEPAPTVAYQIWADTTANLLKIRNAANNAWITIGSLGTANLGLAAAGAIGSSGLTQATARLLGRTTAGTGAPEEIFVGSGLTLSGGQLTATGGAQIRSISASVAANALTVSASALTLDFRSATLGSGTVTSVTGTPSNLVVPSGATLGTVNGVASRLVILALNNGGTIELAVVNLAGGNNLDETGLVSTTAISASSNSSSVIYSTTARTNLAYRVIGFVDSTQATAGTWATAPSTTQGAGGQALQHVGAILNGVTVNSTSGTAIDFTNIPSWVKRVTVMLQGVSSNGGAGFLIQIGPVGGPETSGYSGAVAYIPIAISPTVLNMSSGFSVAVSTISAATVINGQIVLNLLNPATNTWAMSGVVGGSDNNYIHVSGGVKSIAGLLSQVRIGAGGNTFDAGSINILYE